MATDPIPPEATSQELAPATNIAKVAASLGPAIGVIAAAVFGFSNELKDLGSDALGLGVLGLVAVALIAGAYIVVADIRARTQVKVAQIPALAAVASNAEGNLSQWSATAIPMAVRVSGDNARYGVLALRHDSQGRTWYLIGRQGRRPEWVENNQIEDTFYGVDLSQYRPALPLDQEGPSDDDAANGPAPAP